MKKILFCLLAGTVLAFSSCQSDEPTNNSNGETTINGSKAVDFSVGGTSPAVRTHYVDDGSVYWSHNDMIYVYSHYTGAEEDDHQHAHYTIGLNGGQPYGDFQPTTTGKFTEPIYWYTASADKQHFVAYYPAESVDVNPALGGGGIDFDLHTGAAQFHIPADQSAMARVDPDAEDYDSHANPLAYAIASTKNVDVIEGSIVPLEFHDIMNVVRIHINNPSDQVVKGVKITSTQKPLSGTATVTPPSHEVSDGEAADYGDFGNIGLVGSGLEISAVESDPSILLDLYYDLYLLPQQYNAGDLQVTVMIGNDISPANDIIKPLPALGKSALKRVLINVPKEEGNRSYMGIVAGKDFYMATGNLIAVYPSFYRPAEAAPEYYYIAGPVSGGSLYTADDVYYGISEMVSVERDMFKSGQFVDYTYWTYDSSQPSINLNPGTDFAGNGNYDLARLGLGAPWRLPTLSEIEMLTRQYYIQYVWEWKTNYKGIQGLNGMTISNIPGTTDGISSTDPVTTVFLPAQGHWGFVHGGGLFSNDSRHAYWGGTHGNNGIYRTMSFDETSFYSEVINTIGAAIRPVYTHGEEEPQRTPVDFVGESGGGWLITKPQDPSGSDQEETL